MKIAIIGTHFTGKTELAEALHAFFVSQGKDAVLIKEVARRCPMPINDRSTFEAQKWIIAEQIKRENECSFHSVLISDRSVIDNYAYSIRKFPKESEGILKSVLNHSKTYDILMKTTPLDVPIVPDGFRDTDPSFRMDVESILSGFLEKNKIAHHILPANNAFGFAKEVASNG
jgi:nicotinamide riboside kinase